MHKTRYNVLRLTLHLSPQGPLLIKSGAISANPTLPDMQFVRTFHPQRGETVYIPGSSFKGVVRGFVEKVLRTIDPLPQQSGPDPQKGWRWACATFEARETERKDRNKWNCPQWIHDRFRDQEPESWAIYSSSCGACRIFGHTRLKGRAAFTDFLPVDQLRTEIRYGVAISRLSHAVAHGPFEMEIAVSGTFEGHLVLENFELWQVGLLALAIESMNQGFLKVGFGKNRGFGEVRVQVACAVLEEAMVNAQRDVWCGLGAFADTEERKRYGLEGIDRMDGMPEGQAETVGLYLRRVYTEEHWSQIAPRLIQGIAATV
ncbi:MAG: RAMP superfamily CRISPR-associated protein [Thermoflexus sp.]|uniref:RAMP superfamily CRISPR-associated protein n=1 Tax=Thermoflexus sp. TaxID=1969742 RepID=UPI0025DDEBB4|nr:RAMP superfamily CRISPR-associated protein [Thermoflexus sp.]MCS6963912.1 RAMP superfamily CRISPR-associated protein [Thermoflexus sp.]MDW8186248.1 RAMP superfamily CRISPR-associated protein [Anaerolineae bacterium]